MRDLLVLCYHAVSPRWPAALSVTPAALDAQLGELVRRGYRGARFTDALAATPQGPTVVVTFDDGYRSVLELAKPILDRHGLPGTLYVPSDWPDAGRPMRWPGIDRWLGTEHEPELECLGWEELRGLAADGWEIGSHTCSHPRLPQVRDDAELARELRASKARIEAELGRPCSSLAYPYGAVDGRVEAATAAAGYTAACTIPRVLASPRPLSWPRTPIFHVDDRRRFGRKVSPRIRRLRASAAGRRLDRLRVARSERR
ncbi:polysaccharide deacetylase family protein [Conexibacter arvalis]|uniref:Peptidoglycan/xylan/chitin deacetylase (PgdA/CDA1 family) n=1 Tax=Conexibacter arvalis TaxID=912552 RepID=A0A840ICK9_9ACTN|nr:polysaccharide deacetylase family protein [Conexibacter arvalis]MBB4661680.1 peptidoglycan/xylan/chitin deacetylase (PgdA/CDA1 family) [Conexibacter arvalis]